jgi:hypothetical protein
MAAAVMDHAMSPVHGSTVDHTEGVCPFLIRIARARSNGQGCGRARGGGARAGNWSGAVALRRKFASAALDRATGHHFVRERALHVVEKHAHTQKGSRARLVHPRRLSPKGGGTGLAGVRALVLRRAL